MKLVLYAHQGSSDARPGLATERGIVDASSVVKSGTTPQLTMERWIDDFESLRAQLQDLQRDGPAIAEDRVRLFPPLPRPGKIACCIANYWEHAQREARPLNMFLKNPDAVIGPGDTIQLPEFTEPWAFMHEAELALVIKGPAKAISQADWRRAVFGYTCLIDVTARGEGRATWKKNSWMGKSFDTFAPLGPCIVTADEIADPNDLHVQFWNNGELRHNYNTDDMEHRVPQIVELASTIMTLRTGDVLSCGTNHEGLGFLQNGEEVTIAIQGIGRMTLHVADPLERRWERGVYMGADSTNPLEVRRNKPQQGPAPAQR
jgi:2-keto-4-pentenoate hydratase/2-oxohepta-3-ene-1,7-dioic acid hydratase in catechol pathway